MLKVFVYSMPVNMGLSFKGLHALVEGYYKTSPLSGNYFLFFNRKRNYLKALRHDGAGFILIARRLDAGEFPILKGAITPDHLAQMLNDGIVLRDAP